MLRYLLYIICIVFIVGSGVLFISGCAKEYSYEGELPPDIISDSIPLPDVVSDSSVYFPICSQCKENNELLPAMWNFKFDSSFLCGNITRAIKSPDGKGFTFFGPSKCSLDTGIVMTIFLDDQSLDTDLQNVILKEVIFEYYDNKTQRDIFISDKRGLFSLTIQTYEIATSVMTGTFGGYVSTKDHSLAEIREGKFSIKFD